MVLAGDHKFTQIMLGIYFSKWTYLRCVGYRCGEVIRENIESKASRDVRVTEASHEFPQWQ